MSVDSEDFGHVHWGGQGGAQVVGDAWRQGGNPSASRRDSFGSRAARLVTKCHKNYKNA